MKILKTHLSSVVRVRQWWMFPLGLVSVALPFVAAAALIRWMPHRWRRWLRAIRGAGDRESLEGRSK